MATIESLDRPSFIELFKIHLDYKPQFDKIRTILYIELAVRPESGMQEREIIKTTMDGSIDLNKYAVTHMQKNNCFYLMNKRFWDQWQQFTKSKSLNKDYQAKMKIDNQ